MKFLSLLFLFTALFISNTNGYGQEEYFEFQKLPDLPPNKGQKVQPGLAGTYAGVDDGVLILAGGANFPDKLPWEGGKKIYYDG
ncbi:MAG TPA: hypothetical protein VFM69_12620, partial [Pricia sp.]|nr:hypothetical protein [Pricia sp.]